MEVKSKRQADTRRLAISMFVLGMLASAVLFAGYMFLSKHSVFVPTVRLRYYRKLDREFGKYYQMEKRIREQSLYQIDSDQLDQDISRSLVSSIDDPYAEYYTAEDYENLERQYTEGYTGVGIAVRKGKNGRPTVSRVLSDSPAEEAGVKAGDRILSVNGRKTKTVDAASEAIRGAAGTKVNMTLSRSGSSFRVQMIRREVEESSVEYRKLSDAVGYIRISGFREGTSDEFQDAARSLTGDGYTKIIIDVRNNPGGVVKEAVKAADQLLPACRIMTAKDSSGKETEYKSDSTEAGFDYVVLVNGNTASAAEIFAGAIQKNHGGKVIGTTTYGKGLIQSVYKLKDGSALRLTTEEYYLPDGKRINGRGIKPDIRAKGTAAMAAAEKALS